MLDSLKVRFPELPWPNDISSTDKASYSVSFLALLKMTVKNLTKEERILSKEETALVLLERRIEVNFVPELTKKKSKIKTPKLNELTDIDCTACEAKTGVWKLIGETVMLNILQLCCTECGTALSEPFNVLRKVSKKKESSAEKTSKPKKEKAVASDVFKPSAKQLKQHKDMKTAFSLGVTRSAYSVEQLAVFDQITEFLGEDL